MALTSLEDNENAHTKSSSRSKFKSQEKKKQKVKNKSKLINFTSVYERNNIYSLPASLSITNRIPTMLSSYPLYTNYVCPVLPDWTPGIPMQNPVYTVHSPVVNPVQIVTPRVCTQISPYIGVIPTVVPSILTPPNEILHNSEVYAEEELDSYYPIQYEKHDVNTHKDVILETDDFVAYSNEIAEKTQEVAEIDYIAPQYKKVETGDPLEFYLTLPKELFPSARSLTVDPNPIIDEFCKIPNIQNHAPWILDLEFGVPNLPITRPLPTYNVKLNSINCKNAPDAIHPGFESCDKKFKEVLLFYYDCVISAWYRGYIILNNDRSVENFQTWLLVPAQVLGMCWS